MMLMDRVAVVTGAAVGIGKATAIKLASDAASYISCQNIQIDGCRRRQ